MYLKFTLTSLEFTSSVVKSGYNNNNNNRGSNMAKGYVYVLTNPSFKSDWVKIGKSSRLPEIRGRELYNTAVPLPFEIYVSLKTEKYAQAEALIHKSIDRISSLRITPNREFFNISPEKAFEILSDIKDLLGDEAELELKGDNINVQVKTNDGTKRRVSMRFDFFSRNLHVGDVIKFIPDETYEAIVANDKQVFFEKELWYLSPLAKELFTRRNECNSSGAYQGPVYFSFNGIKLTDLTQI